MQHQLQFSFILTSLLPIFILIFVFYYLTKKSINKEKSEWKRRFKWASIVAKAVTTSIALAFLFTLGVCSFGEEAGAGFSCLLVIAGIAPFLLILIIVWGGAFFSSKIVKKENISMLISMNLVFLIIGSYISSYANPFIDNFLKQRQISSIQKVDISESLPPTIIKTDLESVKGWKKVEIGKASLYVPPEWLISSESVLNDDLADYVKQKEAYTFQPSVSFIMKDFVNVSRIFNSIQNSNKGIISFLSKKYWIDAKEVKWGYLQKDGKNIGVKMDNRFPIVYNENIVLFAFYADNDLYVFSIELHWDAYRNNATYIENGTIKLNLTKEQQNKEEIPKKLDTLINNTIPIILGTISFDN